ncbi:MAG: cysteine desulfurase family protein [candidate division WOR-3 bacterium]
MSIAYFDYANSAPLVPEAVEAMLPFLQTHFGNPMSIHRAGARPRQALATAREQVASLIGCSPEELLFTSSASEANNHAIKGLALACREKGTHIVASAIEHVSIIESLKWLQKLGFTFSLVPVDSAGRVLPGSLAAAIRPDTTVVSIQHASAEVGTMQDLKSLAAVVRRHGALFHSDGTAAVGRVSVDVSELDVDAYSFPAQSVYGPKGAAALYLRRGIRPEPLISGGIQEMGRRAGSENVAAIVGFGAAAIVAKAGIPEWSTRMSQLTTQIRTGLQTSIERLVWTGDLTQRVPGHVSLCVEFVEGEALLLLLDDHGIAAASGSSCTARTLKASHVLLAMGLPHSVAQSSLVLTLGKDSTEADVERLLKVLPSVVQRLRAMSPLYARYLKGEDPYAAESTHDHHEKER